MSSYNEQELKQNIVNILSEEQLKKMQLEGTVPPNQDFFTEDEGENIDIDCIKTEVIYDMTDPDKDWGQKNGLVSTVYNADFSAYSSVICYLASNPTDEYYGGQYGNNNVLTLDLTPRKAGQTIFTATAAYPMTTTGNDDMAKAAMLYNSESKHFRPNQWRVSNKTVITDGSHIVYKIEGVLKKASVVYNSGGSSSGGGLSLRRWTD